MRISGWVVGLLMLLWGTPLLAQDKVWLQIEAQPNLSTAMDRVRAYAALFPQVQGYRLATGWYGIAIGPLTPDDAVASLQSMLVQNMIPPDSYISDGSSFGDLFWPVGAQVETPAAPAAPETTAVVAPPADTAPVLPDETVGEARASEAALDDAGRQELQIALKWFGFYEGKIDGSFGSGTRASMANWQGAQGVDPTGVLTTRQRAALIEGYRGEEQAFGFETLSEPEAAIEITLPMAMVSFDRYTPPFVRYAPREGSGVTVLLISEPGTKASLAGLYDVLQSLDIVPAQGDRALEEDSFTIRGRDDRIETLAYAEIVGSNVKGYLLSWDVAQSGEMNRVLPIVQSSFRSTSDKAMDPGLVPLADAVKRGLLAGLSVKTPKLSRSGFFIDAQGSVLTTLDAVAQCGSVTLERNLAARVSFIDRVNGIAVLSPEVPLSPANVAVFAATAPEVGAAVTVSGYSYGERLPAPVLTRGTLEEATGLNGEAGLARLALLARPGDAGGPVLEANGGVVGMLLPAGAGSVAEVPPGVAFAATATALRRILGNPAGPALVLAGPSASAQATPDALNAAARGMTVLVSCWE